MEIFLWYTSFVHFARKRVRNWGLIIEKICIKLQPIKSYRTGMRASTPKNYKQQMWYWHLPTQMFNVQANAQTHESERRAWRSQ